MKRVTFMTFIKITLLLVLFLPRAVCGDTHTVGPTDCSAAAVNVAISAASDGDTVELTCTGSVTWTTTVTIPNSKGITLRVANGTNTPKTSTNFPLVVTSNKNPAIQINTENNNSVTRMSGFKFRGTLSSGNSFFITVAGRGRGKSPNYYGAYRIDNNYFDSITLPGSGGTCAVVYLSGTTGEQIGLVDNNTFDDISYDNYTILIREDWKASHPGGSTICWGGDAWSRVFTRGDNRYHFIEDNLFDQTRAYNRHYVVSDGEAGKYVVRYNTFNATFSGTSDEVPDDIDSHGYGISGEGAGTRGGEIYSNTFTGAKHGRQMRLRGGQWLIYDNTFAALGWDIMSFVEYDADLSHCSSLENSCGFSQFACGNASGTGYPLPDQIQSTYVWNNIYNGSNRQPTVESQKYVPVYIQANRDFFVSPSKPVTLASYTPYTYPHPLRTLSKEPAPPQNLRIVDDLQLKR